MHILLTPSRRILDSSIWRGMPSFDAALKIRTPNRFLASCDEGIELVQCARMDFATHRRESSRAFLSELTQSSRTAQPVVLGPRNPMQSELGRHYNVQGRMQIHHGVPAPRVHE